MFDDSLQKFDTSTICIPNEQVEKIVFEKYDDYKYSYLMIMDLA